MGYLFFDLEFEKANEFGIRQAKIEFPNGYTASVIIGDTTYGGKDGLYELAVMHGGDLCYDTPITSDVIGHLKPSDIDRLLNQIAELPPREEDDAGD